MNNTTKTLIFAAGLGIVCSALLTGTGLITTPKRQANEKAEQIRNYLEALNVPLAVDASPAELIHAFKQKVTPVKYGNLELFEYRPDPTGPVESIAVAFTGPGVWGPIEGVMALEPDLQTIRGVRFFKQEETPGLGAEIASESFLKLFKGRKIVARDGRPGFRIRKAGSLDDQNVVDAITGATMTSDRVEAMLTALAVKLQEKQRSLPRSPGEDHHDG